MDLTALSLGAIPMNGFPLEAVLILVAMVCLSAYVDLAAHSDRHEITFGDAAKWSAFFVAVSMAFYGYLYFRFTPEDASLFLAGYALEKALSADNMIVIMAIMASFGITSGYLQHRILYYGIIGAVLFRAFFVGAGSWLFALGPIVQGVFGLIVIWTAYMLIKESFGDDDDEDEDEDYTDHWSVRYIKNHFPVAQGFVDNKFFVTKKEADDAKVPTEVHGNWFSKILLGGKYATMAFLCLMCVEISDIVFSFDSVPAIIAITQKPLLVYSSIIFAILGLRSLYFLLQSAMKYLVHLDKAVAVILLYVGAKLMIPLLYQYAPGVAETLSIPAHVHHMTSLYIVLGLLGLGIVTSMLFPGKDED